MSEAYLNNKTPLLWECKNKHRWEASFHAVKDRASWCPTCLFPTEALCAEIVASLFPRHSFVKRRSIPWLTSEKTGRADMELDIFSEELGLAFEHNGEQHYRLVPRFHPDGNASLQRQVARDHRKTDLCNDNHVCLVVIPYDIYRGRMPREKKQIIATHIWGEVRDLGYPPGVHLDSLSELLVRIGV